MEDFTSTHLEGFFFDTKKCDLPVLGSIEQFLEASEHKMQRMSPDSTMEAKHAQPMLIKTESTTICANDQVPDSTTSDNDALQHSMHYDSDAFNSEDSCSSFAEAQVMATMMVGPREESLSSSCSTESNSSIRSVKKVKKSKKAGDTLLKCELCQYSTRFKEHLTSHMHTHATTRNYMCSDCGQTFKWSHSLKRHQRTHSPASDFRYTCHFCFKTFSRKDHLSIHESLHTASGAAFPCRECGATFKNKKTLTGHMKTHTAEKAFKCDQCDSEFTRKASLNRHIRAAHAGQVITCPFCPAVFSYRSTLEDHKKAAHNEGRREYGCDLCGVKFAVKAYLSKHMVTCRNRAVGKSFACTLCSKSFPTKRHLHEHNKRKHQLAQQPQPQSLPQQQQQTVEPQQPPVEQYYDTSSYYYPDQHSAVMGHDLPLPQGNGGIIEDDHNVGSLLRLVYSCPDQMDQHHHHQQHNSPNAICQAEPSMAVDYPPILDGISLDYL